MEIPGYRLEAKIGEGGTATVWKAKQLSLDRDVALKVLSHALAPDPDALARFRTEGMAAAKLNHLNIVQVYDAGEVNGVPFFAMEYVDGRSIGDILAHKGRLAEEEALAVIESVARALHYAWEREQIIHCDIKPDNILVEKSGIVKVADLGLARIMSRREGHAERDVIGTPNYVSPEQAMGGLELDYRTDIYSLGATFYHLVTGAMPFAGASGVAAMDMHIDQFLADPADVQPGLSPQTAWLIEKLMVRNRRDRYASWAEVIEDIERVTEGLFPAEPLPEPGTSTVSRNPARPRGTPQPVTAAPPPPAPAVRAAPKRTVQASGGPAAATPSDEAKAKIARALDKHQKTPASPMSIVMKVAVFAAVFVLAFWMMSMRNKKKLLSGTTLDPNNPASALIHPMGHGSADSAAASPIAQPTIIQPTNPLLRSSMKAGMGWEDREYQRAAALYNNAIAAYAQYQLTHENPAVLKRIEDNLHIAIDYFEKCKDRAPKDVVVQPYIDRCHKLIFDVHSSMQVMK